jgi:hypothetical protein
MSWHVLIRIGSPETACERPAHVRLLPATSRTFTKDSVLSKNGRDTDMGVSGSSSSSSSSCSSCSSCSCSSSSSTGPLAASAHKVCTAALTGLLYFTVCFGSSHLHRQAPPGRQRRERPLAGKGGIMGEK